MTWLSWFQPWINWRMRRSLPRRFTIRPIAEIVAKMEEAKYQSLELTKRKSAPAQAEAVKLFAYAEALQWVLVPRGY